RRARQWLRPGGTLIDFHPILADAQVIVGDAVVGRVETDDAPDRQAAASAALAAAVAEGLFAIERAVQFDFFTWADSIEELRDYVAENWRDARIGDAVVARARSALRASTDARPRVVERVSAARYSSR